MDKEDLLQRINELKSRGEIKLLAKQIDKDADLLKSFQLILVERGFSIEYPTKKSIRILRDRAEQSQIRKNPIHLDFSFTCKKCGKEVEKGGNPVRDHCPYCLWGLHVDNVPGDRAANCGALLKPISFDRSAENIWIYYQCQGCQHRFRVRTHPDDSLPAGLVFGEKGQ